MGGSLTKTPLERRNTVIRRSQRKSIHQSKAKLLKIMKDIKRFDGVNISDYQQIRGNIEQIRRELQMKRKDLQPQLRNIYNETTKMLEDCLVFLNDKLESSRKNLTTISEEKHSERSESVIVEEHDEDEPTNLETLENKPDTVELHVVQIEPQPKPDEKIKRSSLAKVGIPVLPGAIINSWFKKSPTNHADVIAETRKKLETIEMEISQFVGQKNGKYYNKLHKQLENCRKRIQFETDDQTIQEQVKLCDNYINSCITFLDERAATDGSDNNNTSSNNNDNNNNKAESEGDDVIDDVFEPEINRASVDGSVSPTHSKITTV